MKKYYVTCTKIYNGVVEVEADNEDEAYEIASEKVSNDKVNWQFGESTVDYVELAAKYKVWCDSQSAVYIDEEYFDDLDKAVSYACNAAHEYDYQGRRVTLYVEDLELDETIDTYESFSE